LLAFGYLLAELPVVVVVRYVPPSTKIVDCNMRMVQFNSKVWKMDPECDYLCPEGNRLRQSQGQVPVFVRTDPSSDTGPSLRVWTVLLMMILMFLVFVAWKYEKAGGTLSMCTFLPFLDREMFAVLTVSV
jgi:hypothetical protein